MDAVEGHGTGTALGDPIEAGALLATYGRERSDGPLWLGSIKTNIGHTQAAAGVAGVIKMVMALRHGVLPPTLHAEEPSPHVDWDAGEVRVLAESVEWPGGERPRRAGVSSFGISGTNAHLILEEAPAARSPARNRRASGCSTRGRWRGWFRPRANRHCGHRLSVCSSISAIIPSCLRGMWRFRWRRVGPGSSGVRRWSLGSVSSCSPSSRRLARGEEGSAVVRGVDEGRTAFMFTGQGAQRAGMGRELYHAFPVFAQTFDEVCAELDRHLERPLAEVVFASEGSPEANLLDRTEFTQPALFALQVALFRLVESLGVRPDFLIGHSIGELAAACVADVWSLADACTLVAARGRLMGSLPEGGAMLAVQVPEPEAREWIAGLEDRVSIAAVNGPRAVVISGDAEAVESLERRFKDNDSRTKRLRVSHAFHSPRMEPMLQEFATVAAGLSCHAPKLPIVSNLSGELLTAEEACSADYWVRHAREAVRFADGVATLERAGVSRFLELGPDGVLSVMARQCLSEDLEARALSVHALRADRSESESFLGFLAEADAAGVAVDWGVLFSGGARRVELPTYAFQRERFWLESASGAGNVRAAGLEAADHPLLGAAVRLAGEAGWLFTGRVSLSTHPWLADHACSCWARSSCRARPSSSWPCTRRRRPTPGWSRS